MPLFGGPPNIDKLKAKKDVKGLIKALEYRSSGQIRAEAAQGLGEIKDRAALRPLIAILTDEDQDVRKASADALGAIGDSEAASALIKSLEDKVEDVRQTAATALGRLDAHAVKPLLAALKNGSQRVRWGAAVALGEIGNPTAIRPLIEQVGVNRNDDYVRQAVSVALGRFGPVAVEILSDSLKHKDWGMRAGAADAVGIIGDAQSVRPLLDVLQDEHPKVRKAVAKALVNLYRSSALDNDLRDAIVQQREAILQKHQDSEVHDRAVGHSDEWVKAPCDIPDYHYDVASIKHLDHGIGVDFPL